MPYPVQAERYKLDEPFYALLYAMIEAAHRDVDRRTMHSRDAQLFLRWAECELVPWLEDVAILRNIGRD